MPEAMDEEVDEMERSAWACDECFGFFTEGFPTVLHNGSHLCENCLSILESLVSDYHTIKGELNA